MWAMQAMLKFRMGVWTIGIWFVLLGKKSSLIRNLIQTTYSDSSHLCGMIDFVFSFLMRDYPWTRRMRRIHCRNDSSSVYETIPFDIFSIWNRIINFPPSHRIKWNWFDFLFQFSKIHSIELMLSYQNEIKWYDSI